ncbi:MAG: hypothetical protein ACJ8BW_04335 [Ktedonobacteraceae bacterium]|jgi:hypothetical protein
MAYKQMLEQALATLWREVAQAHGLRQLTTVEALVVLERRREMVMRLLGQQDAPPQIHNGVAPLMMDHVSTLLKAELVWLEQTLSMMQMARRSNE